MAKSSCCLVYTLAPLVTQHIGGGWPEIIASLNTKDILIMIKSKISPHLASGLMCVLFV